MKWPWKRKPETRSADWADAIAQLEHLRAGTEYVDVAKSSGAEIAAGIVSRAFMVASIQGADQPFIMALTPHRLASMARRLISKGESLDLIRVRPEGRVCLYPATHVDVSGRRADPADWMYDVYVNSPDYSQTYRGVPAASVVHVRYIEQAQTIEHGRGPLRQTPNLADLAARSEKRLAEELKSPVGKIIPSPVDPNTQSIDFAALTSTLKSLAGGLTLLESQASGWGSGLRQDGKQPSDWMIRHLGPKVEGESRELLQLTTTYTAAVLGIPPELIQVGSSSSALREAQRMLFHGTLQPLARLMQAELRDKLDAPGLMIDLSALGAMDVQGKARSLKSLVDSGVSLADARRITGLR